MAKKSVRARPTFRTHGEPAGWAVVGLGMGRMHAGFISKSPGLRLVALCDRVEERLEDCAAGFPGVARYTSIAEVLRDERVGGVSLVLPHDQHAPEAVRCLEAGRHVVLDKPMCLTVAEGRRMIATARKTRRLLSVFHNRRWDADYVTIQRLVDKGTIGRVRYIESRIGGAGRMRPGRWRSERKQMGGLLYDWGAHLIDQALMLMETRPASVSAFAQHDLPREKGRNVEDRAQAQITFEDGSVAVVGWLLASPAPCPRFIVEGEKGGVRVERSVHSSKKPEGKDGVELFLRGRGLGVTQKVVPFAKVDWSAYYRNIGRALQGKEALVVRPEEAIRHVAVAEAAYRSARSGRPVALDKGLF